MVSNDELKADIVDLDLKLDQRLDILEDRMDAMNESYSQMVDHLTGKKKPKAEIRHASPGFSGTGAVYKEETKPFSKSPNAPKRSANGKIPGGYKISGTACKYCNSPIAWPPWDKDLPKDANRDPPIHCDSEGNIKGDGRCPNL